MYIEAPDKSAPSRGKLHVALPTARVPAIHVMYNLYLPAEGKYTVGWGGSGFSGVLRVVDQFTSLAAGAGTEVIRRSAAKQVADMQRQFDARASARALKAGATPIRVRLPIKGKLFRLEKVLSLPGDELFFDVQYRDWKVAK